jgi:hypothetical protein
MMIGLCTGIYNLRKKNLIYDDRIGPPLFVILISLG